MANNPFVPGGSSSSSGTITGYTQTAVISASGPVAIPSGTKYIEALLCGGGGGGFTDPTRSCGGGFGGLQIYNIPLVGAASIDAVIGAGGTAGSTGLGTRGGTTTAAVNGIVVAAVGGGGCGYNSTTGKFQANGANGGGGGGGLSVALDTGAGGAPFNPAQLVWCGLSTATRTGSGIVNDVTTVNIDRLFPGGISVNGHSVAAGMGYGGSGTGSTANQQAGQGGGAGAVATTVPGIGGGGGGVHATAGNAGGSMASVSVWGLTGFAGGAGGGVNVGNGGGGGMLAAGTAGAPSVGGAGGNGGGGGGGGITGAPGGNGFAVFRFYS